MRAIINQTIGSVGLLVLVAAISSVASAEPLTSDRSLQIPAPVVQGLAYADGSLWMLSPMGPGMTTLIRMNPGSGLPSFGMFGSVQADALAHDGTNFLATRDAGEWSCGSANPNGIEVLNPASGALVRALPSPVASRSGGLAVLGGLIYVAGVVDTDPCDGLPGVTSIAAMDPSDGSVQSSFQTDALGEEPKHLASDGTHLLYGTWSGQEGIQPSIFSWTVYSLDTAGDVVDSRVLFETLALTGSQASQSFDIGGMAWGNGELFVLDHSTQTVQVYAFPVAEPAPPPPPPAAEVSLDIRPGDDENCINLRSRGKLPAAVLSSPEFDATLLDPATVTLATAPVVQKKINTWMADVGDVNFDGLADLVLHFETQDLVLTEEDNEAFLHGWTTDGEEIECSDRVKVIHGVKVDLPGHRIGNERRLEPFDSSMNAVSLDLFAIGPNPSRGDLVIAFTLSGSERASVEVVSVTGRRLMNLDVGHLGPGTHTLDIGSQERLPAGMYFVRLRQGSSAAMTKVSVLP